MSVQAIPEGFHSLTAFLSIQQAADAIEFYKKAFGATEDFRLDTPDGRVGYAALRIGNSMLMMSEPCEQGALGSPDPSGKSPVGLHLYVEDVDGTCQRAIEAGAEQLMPVTDMFYGDRTGTLKDPYGHCWLIATHKQDLSVDEIRKRAAEMFNQS
ncbi:VOC family protein [Pseudomonas sp. DWP3-1-2]|jgi:PhnB protein|uniref:VOC family protein n=1 Tax=Pseudomonas sp. DWP3-1-2 TaxID=2804645 RepID=UPI003CEA7D3C